MSRVALLCLGSALLLGCPGSVRLDGGGDSFGAVSSALAVHIDLDGDAYHTLLLATNPAFCSRLETAHEELAAAWNRWDLDLTDDAACDVFWDEVADAWDPLLRAGPNVLAVTLQTGSVFSGLDAFTEIEAGPYDLGSGEALMTTGALDENPFRALADADGGCDNLESQLADAAERVSLLRGTDGDVAVEDLGDGSWDVAFVADVDDEEGAEQGTAEVAFGASSCDVALSGVDALEFLVGLRVFLPWSLQ